MSFNINVSDYRNGEFAKAKIDEVATELDEILALIMAYATHRSGMYNETQIRNAAEHILKARSELATAIYWLRPTI